MKPCNGKYGTCKNTIKHNEKYCPECKGAERARQRAKTKEYDKLRGTATERGYDAAWRKLRAYKLKISPLCACPDCQNGLIRVKSANTVHHIKPVHTHPHLRLRLDNLLSMTRECHEKIEGRKR